MHLSFCSGTFLTALCKPPARAGAKAVLWIDGATCDHLWWGNTTGPPPHSPTPVIKHLPAHHCAKCLCSLIPLASLALPVSSFTLYGAHDVPRGILRKETFSPRKISTVRSLQFTHPLSYCCVFRLHSSSAEKHLHFTRRTPGFPIRAKVGKIDRSGGYQNAQNIRRLPARWEQLEFLKMSCINEINRFC